MGNLLKKYQIEILLFLALACAIIGRLHMWDKYAGIVIATYGAQPYYLPDFVYFISTDVAVFFLMVTIALATKKDLAWSLVIIAIGKILDEFTNPFSYGFAEVTVDALAVAFLFYQVLSKKKII